MPLNSTLGAGSRRGYSGGKKDAPLPGTVGNFAERLASMPEKPASLNQSGTVNISGWGYSGFNYTNLLYTTLWCDADSRHYNVLMIQSQNGTNGQLSYTNAGGHSYAGMIALNTSSTSFSSPESWIGYNDAEKLLFIDSSAYKSVLGVVGSQGGGDATTTEVYFQRAAGVGASTIFNRITNEGDWSQNNTTGSFYRAINNQGYSTAKTNGPWGGGHYGPWGWNTNMSSSIGDPSTSETIVGKLYGQAVSGSSQIYIFERDGDLLSYPPSRCKAHFVFYPEYPCLAYT